MKKVNDLVNWLRNNGFTPDGGGYTYRDKLVRYYVYIDAKYVRVEASIQFVGRQYVGKDIVIREQLEAIISDSEEVMLLAMKSAFLDAMSELVKDYIYRSILSKREGEGGR